jgi:hypothetical protein
MPRRALRIALHPKPREDGFMPLLEEGLRLQREAARRGGLAEPGALRGVRQRSVRAGVNEP